MGHSSHLVWHPALRFPSLGQLYTEDRPVALLHENQLCCKASYSRREYRTSKRGRGGLSCIRVPLGLAANAPALCRSEKDSGMFVTLGIDNEIDK